jgi:hypothetical protein
LATVAWVGAIMRSYQEYSKQMNKRLPDTEETGFRFQFDEKTSEVTLDTYVVPKKATAYAQEIAETQPIPHAFATLLTDSTPFGLLTQFPLGTPATRELLQKVIDAVPKENESIPAYARPIPVELAKGLSRTIQGKSLDFATFVNGPNSNGKYCAVIGLTFDDATGLEKVIQEAVGHKDAPEEVKSAFQFNVSKLEGFNVHKLTAKNAPPTLDDLFGSSDVQLVFGKKGIYAAIGQDALPSIQAAITAKPALAKVFDLAVNPKRLGDLITAGNAGVGAIASGVLGKQDQRISAFYLQYNGGTNFNLRMGLNLKLLPKSFARLAGAGFGG